MAAPAGGRTVGFAIPEGVAFADLHLGRDAVSGDVSFDWAPIEAICAENGFDVEKLRQTDEGNVGGFIVAWYEAHRLAGGPLDLVAEQLLAEVAAEDGRGEVAVQRGTGTLQ